MSRNISTPLLNRYTRAVLERFNSPSFHALFLTTSKSLKPQFLQRFATISWVFWPPPKPSTRIISGHKRITAKVRFVNKVGALLSPGNDSETPIFIAFHAPNLKMFCFFCPFHARFRSQNRLQKTLALGGSACFRPNSPIMKKTEKYIDPYPNDPPTRLTTK